MGRGSRRARALDGYSRSIALAVAPTEEGFLSAAGGDVFPLRVDPDRGLALATPEATCTWSTEGVVLDLAICGEALYAAAFRDGLRAFARGTLGNASLHEPVPNGFEALSVTALDVDATRVVAFGTQANGSVPGGTVHLLAQGSDGFRPLASFEVGAPVHSLASAPLGSGGLVLFVGTGCGSVGGAPAALQRWELRPAEDGAFARTNVRTWSPPGPDGGRRSAIVRDLLLDPVQGRLLAALFWDGVFAFDPLDLEPQVEDGWPLELAAEPGTPWTCDCPGANAAAPAAFHSLALAEVAGGRQLLVGTGPARTDVSNIQYVSDLTGRRPCCSPPPERHDCAVQWKTYGVYAFDLAASGGVARTPAAALGRTGPRGGVDLVPYALAAREAEGGYRVLVASTGYGAHLLRARRGQDGWALNYEATWGSVAPARLPGPAFNDLLFAEAEPPVLLASTESGIAVFPLAGERPLAGPFDVRPRNPTAPRWARGGAILMAALPGPHARVVAGTGGSGPKRPGGLRFYDATDPVRPRPAGTAQLDRGGRGLALAVASWRAPTTGTGSGPGEGSGPGAGSADGDLRRRLYSVQQVGSPGADAGSSLRAWDLGTSAFPLDPRLPPKGAEPTPCNLGVPCVGEFAPPSEWRLRMGAVAAVADGDRRIVWALAHPAPPVEGEPPARGPLGLIVLAESGGSLAPVADAGSSGERPGFVPAAGSEGTYLHEAVRLRLDAAAQRLYAVWVGHFAVFDVIDPARPILVGARDLTGEDANYGLTLSPVDMAAGPEVDGRRYALLALLNDGLAVLDVTDAESLRTAPLARIELPWQTTALLRDPRDAGGRRWFVGQGTGGLVHLELR